MGNAAITPGRCNHPLTGGRGYCSNKAGCKRHTGKVPARPPLSTHSAQYARLVPDARRALDQAIQDPDLLDVRRPIAMAQTLLYRLPLTPEPEIIEAMARQQLGRSLSGITIDGNDLWLELTSPGPGDLALAEMAYAERAMKLIERLARRQTDAVRTMELARTTRQAVIPFLQELALELSRIIHEYVPAEHREAARGQLRAAITRVAAELSRASK